MVRLQRKRFSEPTNVRTFPHGRVDVIELDDVVIGRMTYEPGWRWSIDVKPIAGTRWCEYHHVGVTLSGRLRAGMPDGTELELGPGDIFEIPAWPPFPERVEPDHLPSSCRCSSRASR